jgi:hypothetical protein
VPFLAFLDRDVWLEPRKLSVFLRALPVSLHDRPAYVGLIEHAHGYNESEAPQAAPW